MKKNLLLIAAMSGLVLSACSGTGERAHGRVSNAEKGVNIGLERLGSRGAVRAGGAQFSEGVFVGASPERDNASALLPSHLQAADAVRLSSRDPMTLGEIAQRLSETTGIPHVLALGPTGTLVTNNDSVRSASDVDSTGTATGGGENFTSERRSRSAESAPAEGITMRPNLRGSLSEILDQITSTFEVEWAYADGRILFRDFVTRKYQITALPNTSQSSSTIGANSISTQSAINSDVWTEVRETLGGIIGEGSAVSIGSTTGLITVTARVSDQERVAEYIEQLNGNIGQQISFDVNVMTVVLKENDTFGLDLNVLDSAIDTNGFLNVGTAAAQGAYETGAVNIGVIDGNVNISAVVNALSKEGKVSVQTRAGATTSNNRVAPIEVVDQRAYLREVSVETDDNGVSRTSRTPDTVTTGFQMQLFPRVMNNRDIMVQYTVRLSELNDLKTFGDGDEAVQLPEISTTSFEQQAVLENGQTLVLAGFERKRAETLDQNGAGNGLGVGTSRTATTSRVATVMMITPRIIGRNP